MKSLSQKINESFNEDKAVPLSFLASKLIYYANIMKSSGVKKRNAIYQYVVDSLALNTEEANTMAELLADGGTKDEVTKLLEKYKVSSSNITYLDPIKEDLDDDVNEGKNKYIELDNIKDYDKVEKLFNKEKIDFDTYMSDDVLLIPKKQFKQAMKILDDNDVDYSIDESKQQ